MRIAISGSTGMVGQQLVVDLKARGHEVVRIVRGESEYTDPTPVIRWDISSAMIEDDKLNGVDVVIHLAGSNITGKRWSDDYKRFIRESRVKSTQLLSNALAKLEHPPALFITASAIGIYGVYDHADPIDEDSNVGNDFLANVCQQWEKATQVAKKASIRTVHLRIGIILGKQGGALKQMLPIFKKGLGGKIASGTQIMSWIALNEFTFIIEHIISHPELSGAINVVSPTSVSNASFTKTLGSVLNKPTILPVPGFILKLIFGEMADALLIKGANVIPKKLNESGYQFKHTDLAQTLKTILE